MSKEHILERYATMTKPQLLKEISHIHGGYDIAMECLRKEQYKVENITLSRDNNAEELAKEALSNDRLRSEITALRRQCDRETARGQAFMDVIREYIPQGSND